MGRSYRRDFEYAFHHVMNRAGARRWVFATDLHRQAFMEILGHVVEVDEIEIHAYCLMGNHFHLLVRTPKQNISTAMQRLGSMFTKRFNKIERVDGPLFRGRFKSIIIGHDEYLRQLVRYIHRNPVTAGIARKPQHYKWSSYRAYLGLAPQEWLVLNELPQYFSGNNPLGAMRQFVESDAIQTTDELSIEDLHKYARRETESIKEPARCLRRPTRALKTDFGQPVSLRNVVKSVACYFSVSEEVILAHNSTVKNIPREIALLLARDEAHLLITELATAFSMGRSSASTALARIRQRMQKNANLYAEVALLRESLKNPYWPRIEGI